MPDWTVKHLAENHVCLEFDCGKQPLTDWLKQHARSFDKRDLARAYVAVRPGQARVFGYYAVSNCQLETESLPPGKAKKGLPTRMPIPAALLGKLAVDRTTQGQKLGGLLLVDALRRVQYLAERIGIRLVIVDAIDDAARDFYLHHGFEPLLDDPNRLYMPVQVIRQLGLKPLAE